MLARHAARAATIDLELTGLPALREQASRALRRDMLIFNSLGLSLAVILSAAVARSLRSTIVACVPPFVGAVWALGTLGLCGAPVNILTSVVPSLALVVGTCDSIHFIEDMRRSVRRGIDPLAASTAAVRRVGTACGLTSLVTAVGFASLAAARIDAVRTFGIAAAVGALASFLAVTLLTPLIASTRFCSGMRLGRSSRRAGRIANALAAFSVRHAWPIAAAGCAATLFLGLAGIGLDADNRVVDSLPRGAPAAQALARVDAEFGGALGVDVIVRWPEGIDWREGVVTGALAEVHGILESAAGISHAISLSSIAGELGDRARRRLDAEQFRDLVAPDERAAVVRARVADRGSRNLHAAYDRIDAALADLAARQPGWRFELAGLSVVSARNIRQLVRDLGSSLLLEVVVIGLILAVAFRSPIAGLVSLVPNVFPLTVIGAILQATGRSLDPATVIVFNVCLGLAVDDTVHVLSALARNRRAGLSIATSVRRAIAVLAGAARGDGELHPPPAAGFPGWHLWRRHPGDDRPSRQPRPRRRVTQPCGIRSWIREGVPMPRESGFGSKRRHGCRSAADMQGAEAWKAKANVRRSGRGHPRTATRNIRVSTARRHPTDSHPSSFRNTKGRIPPARNWSSSTGVSIRTRQGISRTFPSGAVARTRTVARGASPAKGMSNVSSPVSPSCCQGSGRTSGSTPMPTKLERWIRSKLAASTARTPSSIVPLAAQSRELPVPYSVPARTTSGVPRSRYGIAAS